jgi:hypothetical protein
MKHHRATWALSIAALLCAGACQSGPPSSHASPTTHPSVSAATPDAQRCARLAQRGFTPCPPTPDRLALPATTIRNATNGAVSDATAREWGRAFQLTEAYYRWAMQANARGALTGGAFADSTTPAINNLFGTDLMDLDNAKQAGGVLMYEPPAITVTQLVVVPSSLQQAMGRQGLKPTSYALAVRFVGPTRRSIRAGNGSESLVISRDATYSIDALIWGETRSSADLGIVWFEDGIYGCEGQVRNACQL